MFDAHKNTAKEVIHSINLRAQLGMKRNGLHYKAHKLEADKWSRIFIHVHTVDNSRGPVGYVWRVGIERFARIGPSRFQVDTAAKYSVAEGKCGTENSLIRNIETTLDQIFLAYLSLPKEDKKND